MRKPTLAILAIVALAFLASGYFYPQVPNVMITHWGFQGEPDGYMSKEWGLFLIPSLLAVFALLFVKIPEIDPLKKNIEKFRPHYDNFIILLFLFLFAIQLVMILWNLGVQLSFALVLPPLMAMLFYYVGVLCAHAEKNWFIGIRTPWTMSSDAVWEKTNKLAGKLFKISAAIILLSMLLPELMVLFILGPVVFTGAYTVWYSYSEYQKERKSGTAH